MIRDNIMYPTQNSQTQSYVSCMEVYEKINTNMLTAIMFHEQVTDLFDFLSLHGFKRMHEYQYMSESIERRRLKRYVLNHHGKLLQDNVTEPVQIIPKDWYGFTRKDVTPQVRTQYIEKVFEDYCSWEKSSKKLYEECAKTLLNMGYMADFHRIMVIVEDVDCELKMLERLYLDLKSVGYNEVYVATLQPELHEKYRKKTAELKIEE